MATLRVFVSSTCYDLTVLRSELRLFIQAMSYEPIMSDYEDVLYDPRIHTHTSCVDEVTNCDILLLIIGSRYGGKGSIEALNRIDFEKLSSESQDVESLKEKETLSVTQLEVLKAIENTIPVYTFIDKKVWHDHKVYEKNKDTDIIDKIFFPSIENQLTAKYIFKFINFVRLRTKGNNIFPFEKAQDIEEILKKQWGSYFQRLLNEQRFIEAEKKRIDILSEQFEDLKTAILTSIDNGDQKEIARGVMRYRRLFDFIFALHLEDITYLKTTQDPWDKLLHKANIQRILDGRDIRINVSKARYTETYLITNDNKFIECRLTKEGLDSIASDWNTFIKISSKSREVIIEALYEMRRQVPGFLRYSDMSIDEYLSTYTEFYVRQVAKLDKSDTTDSDSSEDTR